ncbi:hypothetical protein KXD40_003702 [Peronospora effusa]|nr:hypothetical protein KXD40_003702 [Peronospora effusa]
MQTSVFPVIQKEWVGHSRVHIVTYFHPELECELPIDLLAEASEVDDSEFRVIEGRRISLPVFDIAAAAPVGVCDDVVDGVEVVRCRVCLSLPIVDGTEEREDVKGFDDPAAFAGRGLDTRLAEVLCVAEAGVAGESAGRVLKGGCKGIWLSDVEASSARIDRGVANPDIERF